MATNETMKKAIANNELWRDVCEEIKTNKKLNKHISDLEDMLDFMCRQSMNTENVDKYVIGKYEIYFNGIIYDTENADDIPQIMFKVRDFILKKEKI